MDKNKLRYEILNTLSNGIFNSVYTCSFFGVQDDIFLTELSYLKENKFIDGVIWLGDIPTELHCGSLREQGELFLSSIDGAELFIEKEKIRFALLSEIDKDDYGFVNPENLQETFNLSDESFDSAIRYLESEEYIDNIPYGYYTNKEPKDIGRPKLSIFTKVTSKGKNFISKYRV